MRIIQFTKIFVFALLYLLSASGLFVIHAQQIQPADPVSINADDFMGPFTTLQNGPVLTETAPGQINMGFIEFRAPANFVWDTTGPLPTVDVTLAPGFNGTTALEVVFVERTANLLRFQVVSDSDVAPRRAGRATFGNFRLRPANGTIGVFNVTVTSASTAIAAGSTSFGEVTKTAGADSIVRVETKPDGTGTLAGSHELAAGNSITVYSVVRDQFNNFKSNQDAEWNLNITSGGILQSDLNPETGFSSSAIFTGNRTGTAEIIPSIAGLTPVNSGEIEVVPAAPAKIVIAEQTGDTTYAAGELFDPYVIELRDNFENVVNDGVNRSVTASRNAGEGTLQGTTSVSTTSGVFSFTNLFITKSNEIDLRFAISGFADVVSETITIVPDQADALIFTQQPNTTNRQEIINPFPRVQITDQFGNFRTDEGESISLNLFRVDTDPEQGANFTGASTITVLTNANGAALFENLAINQPQNVVREYRIEAVHDDDVTVSEGSSNSFAVVEGGALARFTILEDNGNGGTAITDKTAGEAVNLVLRAETSDGTLVDDFNGSVTISTTGVFATSVQTTINFTAGEAAHTIALIKSGLHSLSVDNDDGPQIGSSNEFTIHPDDADPAKSVITSNPETVIANGSSASTITVQLIDQFENLLTGDGDTVEITTTAGVFSDDGISTLSNADQTITGTSTNGKFTAQITSNDVGSAIINAKVNTMDLTESSAGVEFTFSNLTNFRIEDAGTTSGEISSPKTAGTPFNIKITAFDDYNNVVTDFDGTGATVVLTTSGVFGAGQQTTTNSFTNGVLESFAVTIITSGSQTITARRSGFTEQTTSNSFQIEPDVPDPVTSVISSEFAFLENDGAATSDITVTLKDQFNNNITRDNDNISVEFTQPVNSSLNPAGGLTASGTFTSVLTAGTLIEDVTIEAFIDISGDNFSIGTVTVSITEINEWTSGGGQPAERRNWDNAANWLLGVPTTGQIVIIPTNPVNDTQFPRISDSNPVIDFLVIRQDATINVENGITFTINENISGNGALIGDNSIFNLGGDITVSNITAGTSVINLTSSSHQIGSSTNFVGNIINIGNTVSSVVTGNGYIEAATRMEVAAGSSIIMGAGSQLVMVDEIIIIGDLTGNESVFSFGGNIDATGANISLNDTNVEFNGETAQTVNGFSPIKNLTINNQQEVIYQSDLTVTGTLSLVNGFLTILSGNNLVANTKSGTLSNIRMQRDITGNAGWRVISSPLNTTFDNLLDGAITQGFPGAIVANPDSMQPNVLWYNETVSLTNENGTDNRRWRAPADASNNVTAGRGYFVYFFDEAEVAGDESYDQFTTGDFFPYLLQTEGAEFNGNGTEVILPVTYTAEADTGWNLVGNPFAATIDWDDGTWQKTNVDNTIYVWDESTNQYLYWNGVAGTLGTGKIAPFQGFWVKANGNGTPNLRVRKSTKTTGGTFKKDPDRYNDIPVIALKLSSDFYSTAAHLTFTRDGSFNVDPYDAYRLLPFQTDTFLEIFSLFKDGTELAINNLPRDFGKPIEIPIHAGGIKNGAHYSGPVTISWPELDNIPNGWTIELVDKINRTSINMQNEEFYTFELSSQNKAKTPPRVNSVDNFQLLSKSKETAQNARFSLIIAPGDDGSELPQEVTLNQNFPNPFNPATTIKFGLPVEDRVRIDVYDILGRRVQTIANERFRAGFHEVRFEASSLASGVYFYRLVTSDKVLNKKMTLIK